MTKWQLDPYLTQVEFSAKHLGIMNVRGHFAQIRMTADIDLEHLETASVEAVIQAASIRTHNEARDRDICSSRFLDVETYPEITFKSTNVKSSGPDLYVLTGDLTIKGHTHPVALHVVKTGEVNDELMGHRIAYSANAEIDRKEFGLGFNLMLDGKFVVSDEIKIMIDGELVEQQDAAEMATGLYRPRGGGQHLIKRAGAEERADLLESSGPAHGGVEHIVLHAARIRSAESTCEL